ncbi:hypothetical protein V2I93_04205 [Pseudomonas viridiflava]|uniref:hypothetical protein n=1 Tax=Pseudomonas viridiflava TaxID=33069 RepID=UPI002EB3D7E1|nr:hypothetical protein [Pseudomonas viridiflava]
MKLTVAHSVLLIVAISLLDAGQRSADLALSKVGFCALALTCVLLFTDLVLGAVESFRDESVRGDESFSA